MKFLICVWALKRKYKFMGLQRHILLRELCTVLKRSIPASRFSMNSKRVKQTNLNQKMARNDLKPNSKVNFVVF